MTIVECMNVLTGKTWIREFTSRILADRYIIRCKHVKEVVILKIEYLED